MTDTPFVWPPYPLDPNEFDPVAVLINSLDKDLQLAAGRSCCIKFAPDAHLAAQVVELLAAFWGFACVHSIGDEYVTFGLCDGGPIEDAFVAYAERLGARYIGS